MPIRRRELLLGLAGLAACRTRATDSPIPEATITEVRSGPREPSVIVLGAGLAGLTAALELVERGYRVTLLEAQERPGGRILTLREPLSDGLHVEVGAKHLVADPDLLALAEKVGVATAPAPRGPRMASARFFGGKRSVIQPGEEVAPEIPMRDDERALDFGARLARYFPSEDGLSPDQPGWLEARLALDGQSAADYLRSEGASEGFVRWMEEAFVPGDSIDASSALSIAREAASIQREIALSRSGGGGRIVGGTDRLPHALAARLGERVVYRAVVRHFAEVADGVRVVFERRGEREEMIAERLVCAIPYSVLRHLSRPRLSQEKERAIAEQRLVSVARSFVEYRERPWRRRGESGRAESDLAVGSLRDELEAQDGATGILSNYLTGSRARQSCSVDDDARIAGFIEDVERIHPGSRAQVRVGATTCWDSDPYARGAYAWFAPGELRFLDKSHAPEGRIHFAGDHTSHRPGFMHGAVASAKRVVREIARVTSR